MSTVTSNPPPPLPPTGRQLTLAAGGYAAVVTEGGGALRSLTRDGRPLLDGFDQDAMPSGGRGQLLVPWPNRIRDGRYAFGDRDLRLPLTEPARSNASHGLARWVAWTPSRQEPDVVELTYRLMAQTGYPWTLDLAVQYAVGEGGLVVTQRARNRSSTPAPYASGAHPYLLASGEPPTDDAVDRVDGWELTLPGSTRVLVDERKLPVAREAVAGTAHDFTTPRAIGDLELDDAYTDLVRDADDRVVVTLRDRVSGRAVELWGGPGVRWLQVYTADDQPATARRSVAVEPMTAGADAFRSGEDLLVLAPDGRPGSEVSVSWGIRAVDEPA